MYQHYCFECFNYIGDIMLVFRESYKNILKKYGNIRSKEMEKKLSNEINDLYDLYKIPKEKHCCRNYLMTYTNINEIIGINPY
jgi:DNA-directed RNA polymerase subunit N (RpoN/RPB10)